MIGQPLRVAWWKTREWFQHQLGHEKRGDRRHAIGRFVLGTVGRAVNRPGSMFLLGYRPDFDYDFRRFPEFAAFLRDWVKGSPENRGDLARLYLLYLNARRVVQEGIEGDFVELGVYKGNSARILSELAKPARRTFLFDTFEGFDPNDLAKEGQKIHEKFLDTSLTAVRQFVGDEMVTYVAGRFPGSLAPATTPRKIALAHIDCDLYEPMKAGLETFYDLMSTGGICILHDYGSGWWEGATRAVDEFLADKPERLVLMPDACGTAVFRKI